MPKKGEKNRPASPAGGSDASGGSATHPAKAPRIGDPDGMEATNTSPGMGTALAASAAGGAPEDMTGAMPVTMAALQELFLKMETRLGARLDGVHQQLAETRNEVATLTNVVEENKKNADSRLAALERAVAAVPPPASVDAQWPLPSLVAPSAPSGSAAGTGPGAGAPRGRSSGPRRSHVNDAHLPMATNVKVKVLALGFKRELPRAALEKHWNKVKGQCPEEVVAGCTLLAGSGKAYAVAFPSTGAAAAFVRYLAAHGIDTTWKGSKDLVATKINYRADKSPEEQAVGKLFAPFFLRVRKAVMASPNWHKSYRYYVDTKKGRLRVESEEDIWTLCTLDKEEGKNQFIYDVSGMQYFGLNPGMFQNEVPEAGDNSAEEADEDDESLS
jgi:hypothetical protein